MAKAEFLIQLAEVFEVDEVDEQFDLEGKWDSLVVLSAVSAIDDEFGVTVPIKSLMQTKTVSELLKLIEQSVAAEGQS